MNSTIYLYLDLFTLLGPLALSFDKKVAFYRNWLPLMWGILAAGTLFIVWDIWFTEMGVWGFTPSYLVGISAFGLPVEEWMFFVVVPYACMFIYEVISAYFPTAPNRPWARWLAIGLVPVLLVLGLMNLDKWYTSITFIGTAILLLFNVFVLKVDYLGRFWKGYIVSLVPFLLVNGVLTALPVVWYNNAENLAIRIYTIPVEDSMYLLWLLLMCTNVYEWVRSRNARTNQAADLAAA